MTLGSPLGGFAASLFGSQQMNQSQSLAHLNAQQQFQALANSQRGFPQMTGGPTATQMMGPGYSDTKADWSELPHETKWGEIIAYRAWKFDNGILTSPYTHTKWIPGDVMDAGISPCDTQSSGVFAHKKIEQVFEQESGWLVVGSVALWGEIVEHEHGYRSQYARILSFDHFASTALDGFKDWLRKEYLECERKPAEPPQEDDK